MFEKIFSYQEKSEWESLKQPEDESFYEWEKRKSRQSIIEYLKRCKALKVRHKYHTLPGLYIQYQYFTWDACKIREGRCYVRLIAISEKLGRSIFCIQSDAGENVPDIISSGVDLEDEDAILKRKDIQLVKKTTEKLINSGENIDILNEYKNAVKNLLFKQANEVNSELVQVHGLYYEFCVPIDCSLEGRLLICRQNMMKAIVISQTMTYGNCVLQKNKESFRKFY